MPISSIWPRWFASSSEGLRRKVTEGTLTNYVANSDPDGIDHGLESRSLLALAVCYVTAHYVLDLIDEREAETVLSFL